VLIEDDLAGQGTRKMAGAFPTRARSAESDMTNFMRRPDHNPSGIPAKSPMMVAGLVVAIIVIGGLTYTFSRPTGDRPPPNQGATHQTTEPAAPPTVPAPTPKP
jgi:hypothetical protein